MFAVLVLHRLLRSLCVGQSDWTPGLVFFVFVVWESLDARFSRSYCVVPWVPVLCQARLLPQRRNSFGCCAKPMLQRGRMPLDTSLVLEFPETSRKQYN